MKGEAGRPSGLLGTVGGGLYRRTAYLLGDNAAAARAAEELFVRFVVHGRAPTLDSRARWSWIYRVATNHCLRLLPDDARPGDRAVDLSSSSSSSATVSARAALPALVPRMDALRRLDEATRLIVVLTTLDGLLPDEIADVLGLPAKLVRRRVAESAAITTENGPPSAPAETHPSLLALDRDRVACVAHLVGCARCREAAAAADALIDRFAREIAPEAAVRVTTAIRSENARRRSGPGWKRALWLGGGLVLVSSLALFVARPRAPDRVDVPYAGLKGASRTARSGIQITVGRGAEVRALDPGAVLRRGDRLYFRVRSDRPRYLELRVRDGGGDARVFPESGTQAVLVRSGQALDRDYVVQGTGVGSLATGALGPSRPDGGSPDAIRPDARQPDNARPDRTWPDRIWPDRIWIVGLFADHPFTVDRAPGPDTEVVPVRAEVQR